jgi:hypothetical protein
VREAGRQDEGGVGEWGRASPGARRGRALKLDAPSSIAPQPANANPPPPPPKGTAVEKSINYLFEGHTESYVECKDVDVRSTKRESFMDIQLVVRVRGRALGGARGRGAACA